MRPLDFIVTGNGNVGMITEVAVTQGIPSASVAFLGSDVDEKNAWWDADEFTVIGNLPDLLAKNLSHPFGSPGYQPFDLKGPKGPRITK
jgi:hypothetical protein